MIDMVFLLLIFFLVNAQMIVVKLDKDVRPPIASNTVVDEVRNGRIVETAGWLIRPPAGHDRFFEINVGIHGIHPDDVESAPTWTEQLPALARFTGDDVLVELTRLVSGFIRESDILGRWGGDEFLIILPETSRRQAKRLAESIRTLIREHSFEHVGHLRCSFGAESYRFGDTIKTLMDRVDTQLYEDKKHKEPWRGHHSPGE